MKCEKCQVNEANVKFHLNVNGDQHDYKLCSACYNEERKKLGAAMGGMNMGKFPTNDDLFKSLSQQPFQMNSNYQAQPQTQSNGGSGGLLDEYGRNLTDAAKAGLIDPVIGRDEEVKRVIEILNRRNKNNPVLIGEPGVGKTAIAEGLALKIAEGEVPVKLQ